MDKYAKIRDANLKEQNRRFKEVTEKYDDVAALIGQKRKLQSGFDMVLSSEKAFVDYTEKVRSINGQIAKALVSHGLPDNYLDPVYNCPICRDKGVYYEDGIVPRRCSCNCDGEEKHRLTFRDFNLELFSREKPEGYRQSPYDYMNKTLQFARNYCSAFPGNPKPNILLYGTSGLGKSFLASCMYNEIKDRGFSSIKVNAYKLIDDFKEKHINDTPYPCDYFGCDFLVIDDIGTEPMYNKITLEYLFALVNERIENGLATVFVTNLNFENTCRRYDERLASRMFDNLTTTSIPFYGENLRMKR